MNCRILSNNSGFRALIGCTKSQIVKKRFDQMLIFKEVDSKKFVEDIFKKIEKSTKKSLSGFLIPLKKQNGFLSLNTCSLKLTIGTEKHRYLVVVCHEEKFVKPKAELIVDDSGQIIAHNSSLVTIFGMDKHRLKDEGILKIDKLVDMKIEHLEKYSGKPEYEVHSLLCKDQIQKSKKIKKNF